MKAVWPLLALLCAAPSPPAALWFGGDLSLGQGRTALGPLAPLVRGRGPGVLNLEGPVVDPDPAGSARSEVTNSPGGLEAAKALGVAVLGIANNHAGDRGDAGRARTLAAVRAQGLIPVGEAAGVAVLQLGPRRVAITAHDLTHGVPKGLESELKLARREGEILVATFHVTGPAHYLPSEVLREAAEIALRSGARAVLAHGSHVVGPLERRGDAVIAWGLGNVAFACDCTDVGDALLVGLRFDGDRTEVSVLPIEAGLRGAPARPAQKPGELFDLLEALGTPPLVRRGAWAELP